MHKKYFKHLQNGDFLYSLDLESSTIILLSLKLTFQQNTYNSITKTYRK